jgi:hypothetical protein
MAHSDAVASLLADSDLLRTWGEFNAEWDEIERQLYLIFDALIEDDPAATVAIFFSQTSHAARRSMIQALANYILRNDPHKLNKLNNLLTRVKARSDARNKLAHGLWRTNSDDSGSEETFRIAATTSIYWQDYYPKNKLKRLSADMKDTRIELGKLSKQMSEEKFQKREDIFNQYHDQSPTEPRDK